MAKILKIKILSNLLETYYSRATNKSAGLDLYANLKPDASVNLYAHETALVPTGIAIQLPDNTVGLICPRSGLAQKEGLTVLNGPGVIDEDYTGEIKVLIHNTTDSLKVIIPEEKIAQLVIVPCIYPKIREVTQLTKTKRGDKGFGSSGK